MVEAWQILIAFATLLATVGGSLVVAVWAISRINTTAEVLGTRVEALNETLKGLRIDLADHEMRLRELERNHVTRTQ